MRISTRYPEVRNIIMVPTPEQVYARESKKGQEERKISERNEHKKEEDPMWDEEVEIIKEDFPDPELPRNLDERLRFGSPTNKEEYNVCQNGMTYEVENPEAKRMPSNRQVHPYRSFVLTATESEDSAKKSQTLKEECYVDCWTSDKSEDGNDEDDRGKSIDENECIDEDNCIESCQTQKAELITDEAKEVDEFNKLCGDYDKPFHHQRKIRMRDSTDEEQSGNDEPEPEKQKAKKRRVTRKPESSSDDSTTSDDTEESDEDIERIAHNLSDSEDNTLDKTEIKKELEKLTEKEIKRKYNQWAKELKGCRKRVRDRLARKLEDVKSSDMVGLIRRLKTKLKILDEVKVKRIAALYKRQRELRQKMAEKKLRETLERGDAKKKLDEQTRVKPGNISLSVVELTIKNDKKGPKSTKIVRYRALYRAEMAKGRIPRAQRRAKQALRKPWELLRPEGSQKLS